MSKIKKNGNIKNLSELYSVVSKNNSSRNMFISVFLIIPLVLFTLVFSVQNLMNQTEESKYQELAEVTTKGLIDNFFSVLKTDYPSVVFVEDPVKAQQDNPEAGLFYRNAQPGDVMFVFKEKNFLVLYRPQTGEIINTALVRGVAEN